MHEIGFVFWEGITSIFRYSVLFKDIPWWCYFKYGLSKRNELINIKKELYGITEISVYILNLDRKYDFILDNYDEIVNHSNTRILERNSDKTLIIDTYMNDLFNVTLCDCNKGLCFWLLKKENKPPVPDVVVFEKKDSSFAIAPLKKDYTINELKKFKTLEEFVIHTLKTDRNVLDVYIEHYDELIWKKYKIR